MRSPRSIEGIAGTLLIAGCQTVGPDVRVPLPPIEAGYGELQEASEVGAPDHALSDMRLPDTRPVIIPSARVRLRPDLDWRDRHVRRTDWAERLSRFNQRHAAVMAAVTAPGVSRCASIAFAMRGAPEGNDAENESGAKTIEFDGDLLPS